MKHLKTFEAYLKSKNDSAIEAPETSEDKKVAKLSVDENKNIVVECGDEKAVIENNDIEEDGNDDAGMDKLKEALKEVGATHVTEGEDDEETPVNEFIMSMAKRLLKKQDSHQRVIHHLIGKKQS